MTNKARILEWPTDPVDALPTALWTAADVAAATGGKTRADCFVANIATDSREIEQGGLFFALQGEAMDGHKFLTAAREAGPAWPWLNASSTCLMCWSRTALRR
jgi:UDP-N-acetylmuramoyl-tripeptide--D-alanyl-D-alanine ligase